MQNPQINKFGLCFVNCEHSDRNLIKLLMHKVFLDHAVVDSLSISVCESEVLGMKNFLKNYVIIIWVTELAQCYQAYSILTSYYNKYAFYGVELSELNKDFELIEFSSIFYLFNGEFYGVVFNGFIFNPNILTIPSPIYLKNFCTMAAALQEYFINLYQFLLL